MHRGHVEDAWQHTSATMALIANVNRDAKKRPTPYSANDFNPFTENKSSRGEPLTVGTLDIIRQAIRDRKDRQ